MHVVDDTCSAGASASTWRASVWSPDCSFMSVRTQAPSSECTCACSQGGHTSSTCFMTHYTQQATWADG